MGTPVPDEWPEIEDDKWYAVDCTNYWVVMPLFHCDGPVSSYDHCCSQGDKINTWYADDMDCRGTTANVCGVFYGDTSLITCIKGPYDTEEECEGA